MGWTELMELNRVVRKDMLAEREVTRQSCEVEVWLPFFQMASRSRAAI